MSPVQLATYTFYAIATTADKGKHVKIGWHTEANEYNRNAMEDWVVRYEIIITAYMYLDKETPQITPTIHSLTQLIVLVSNGL